MQLRVINPAQVIELLPMSECIDVVEQAMRCASNREAVMPLRTKMDLPGGSGMLGMMPGYMADPAVFGMKLVGFFEENFAVGLHSHNGIVVLFETEHGRPFAIVDASEITAIRTAAASALATRLLAREDVSTLTITGYGAQGRRHLESMLCVRDFDRVRIWGRSLDKSRAFAAELGPKFGVEITAVADARESVSGSDVICTVSASPVPIVMGEWLEPGQHINAVGTSFPGMRELDGAAVARSRMFVDLREGALAQAGEFQMACDEGLIDEHHILGEVGELSLGRVEGRTENSQITLYKSLGLVVQDLATAHHVYRKAEAANVGVTTEF